MNEAMLVDILVFSGLMALLGTFGKLALALINRRRGGLPAADPKLLDELNARLAHLEQVADSTAVEIERIGEGQRFTTKLLSERAQSK
ncbi:MAG TPA: hypothetical protein VF737_14805 [Gemmatimonadaceae bacterium]